MTSRVHVAAVTVIVALLLARGPGALAQPVPSAPSTAPAPSASAAAPQAAAAAAAPAARPQDVASLDAILAALYDVISGPAAAKRDWDRFLSLFVQDARLIPIGRRQGSPPQARVLTPEDYVARAAPVFEQNGFFEREVARTVETFGPLTHVFSTYESRHARDEEKPFARGINSIQLLNDGTRWWIVTVYWQAETPDTPLPDKYLPRN
jgi:hypothetical protein